MSQPPPLPPDNSPASHPVQNFSPGLPPGPPPMPPGPPPYLPPPAPRGLLSRPVFWISLAVGILALIAILTAAGFAGYTRIIKSVKQKQAAREALAEMDKWRQESLRANRKQLDENGVVTPEHTRSLDKVKGLLDKAGEGTTDDAAAARAAATWTQTVSDANRAYTAAAAKIEDPVVMDASSLESKEDIALRRASVQAFLAANQHFSKVYTNSSVDFTALLRAEGIPENRVPDLAASFTNSLNRQMPLIGQIRAEDAAYGKIMMQWLDLVEAEWGGWKVESGELSFSRQEAQDRLQVLSEELEKIGGRQAAAQRELIELQEKGN